MNVAADKVAEFRRILGQQAGPLPSKMDTELGGEDMEFARGGFVAAHQHARTAHRLLGDLGEAFKALEAWGRSLGFYADEQTSAPHLPPGMVVEDVATVIDDAGDRTGTGVIPIAPLTYGNLSYVQQNGIMARWREYFAGTLDELNAKIGVVPGNEANAPQDPIVRNERGDIVGDLSQPPQAAQPQRAAQ